jgi:hypothetical protein
MTKRIAMLIVLAAVASLVAGVAFATTPSGLTSQLLARGAAGEFRIHDRSTGLKIDAKSPTDVALVRATLAPGGSTDWHGHPGPSIVVVNTGTLTMYEPTHDDHGDDGDDDDTSGRRHGGCSVQTFGPGRAFVHPEHVHNFVNHTSAPVEFYVVYLVPAGATPLLTDVSVPPSQCP